MLATCIYFFFVFLLLAFCFSFLRNIASKLPFGRCLPGIGHPWLDGWCFVYPPFASVEKCTHDESVRDASTSYTVCCRCTQKSNNKVELIFFESNIIHCFVCHSLARCKNSFDNLLDFWRISLCPSSCERNTKQSGSTNSKLINCFTTNQISINMATIVNSNLSKHRIKMTQFKMQLAGRRQCV